MGKKKATKKDSVKKSKCGCGKASCGCGMKDKAKPGY